MFRCLYPFWQKKNEAAATTHRWRLPDAPISGCVPAAFAPRHVPTMSAKGGKGGKVISLSRKGGSGRRPAPAGGKGGSGGKGGAATTKRATGVKRERAGNAKAKPASTAAPPVMILQRTFVD